MASRTVTQSGKSTSTERAPKPAAKTAETTSPATSRAPRKKSTSTAPASHNAIQLTPEERQRYVAEAAYFIAERRGFGGGSETDDWLQAETEIDRLLAGSTRH